MSFDFVNIYSSYSNVELLKIMAEPHKYQPDAVAAVQKILSGRDITELDKAEVALELQPKTTHTQAINTTGGGETDLGIFNEDMSPEVLAKINNWKYTVLLFIGFEFLYRLYYLFQYLWYVFRGTHVQTSWLFLFNLAIVFVSPVGLFLFMKGSKPGWMILVGKSIVYNFLTLLSIGLSVFMRGYSGYAMSIFFLLIFGVAFYFLWKPQLYRWYGIDRSTAVKTLIISTIAGACCGIIINFNLFRTLML